MKKIINLLLVFLLFFGIFNPTIVKANDNLTGLTSFRIVAQGHVVED